MNKIIEWLKFHWIWTPEKPLYNKNGSTVFYIRAPHHLYLGFILMVTGWLCAPYYPTSTTWFYIVGLLIFIDDLIEHTIYKNTPLRRLFDRFNFWLR